MELLTSLFARLHEITGGNAWASGLISAAFISGLLLLAKSIPMRLWLTLKTQLTTSIVLHNTGYWGNRELFLSFMDWYWKSLYARFSRRLSLESKDHNSNRVTIGPGYGIHWFLYKGRFCWFIKAQLDSSGAETVKESIEIFTFGRSSAILYELVESFRPKLEESDSVDIYRYNTNGWDRAAQVLRRDMETVVLDPAVKHKIFEELNSFFADRDWYLQKNIPHKLTAVFHGIPGTGKTSVIKALASYYGVPIYIINISEHTDRSFQIAMETVPQRSFILIEDFDSAGAVKSRFPSASAKKEGELDQAPVAQAPAAPSRLSKEDQDEASELLKSMLGLSLTGVLNTLDGIVSLDSVGVFLTTNKLESIDPAVIRDGRVDLIVEFEALRDPEIREFARIAHDVTLTPAQFLPIPGCELHGMLRRHRRNIPAFIAELESRQRYEQLDWQPPKGVERGELTHLN